MSLFEVHFCFVYKTWVSNSSTISDVYFWSVRFLSVRFYEGELITLIKGWRKGKKLCQSFWNFAFWNQKPPKLLYMMIRKKETILKLQKKSQVANQSNPTLSYRRNPRIKNEFITGESDGHFEENKLLFLHWLSYFIFPKNHLFISNCIIFPPTP